MRRFLILVLGALMWVVMAVPASANDRAQRFTEEVTGGQFECDNAVYTITSGEIRGVVRHGTAAQGNDFFTFAFAPRGVVAEDESGNVVSIVGAASGSGAFNANTSGEVLTFTEKFQLVGKGGGTVGSVNVTEHFTAQPNNSVSNEFDFGNCSSPEE